jgi:hypothetical protein
MKDSRLRIRLDDDLEAAIVEKIVAEHEVGMEVDRAQCLAYFARLGVKAWRGQKPAQVVEINKPAESIPIAPQEKPDRLMQLVRRMQNGE